MRAQISANENFHRELYRRSQDDVMVYNPTEQDYTIYWDGFPHIIPAKNRNIGWGNGKRETKRYIGELFAKRMVVQLINEQGQKAGEKRVKEMEKNGVNFANDADGKYKENIQVWGNQGVVPRTDNPELVEKYWDNVFLGIVREYGVEVAEQDMTRVREQSEPLDEKIKVISNKKYTPEEEYQPVNEYIPETFPEKIKETLTKG